MPAKPLIFRARKPSSGRRSLRKMFRLHKVSKKLHIGENSEIFQIFQILERNPRSWGRRLAACVTREWPRSNSTGCHLITWATAQYLYWNIMKKFYNSGQAFHDRIKETEETQKKLQSHLNKTLQVSYQFIIYYISIITFVFLSFSQGN